MHSHSALHRRALDARVALLAAVLIATGCAGDQATEPDSTPSSLIIVQGTNQAVQAGKELPNAIVLRVLTSDGKPVEKVSIGFTLRTACEPSLESTVRQSGDSPPAISFACNLRGSPPIYIHTWVDRGGRSRTRDRSNARAAPKARRWGTTRRM